ncbi:MAG: glycosyltransferase family 39 protein [Phycisphaeraceae bacterium]|nr:glycosyltransferase family 39 protein [Phycisphaeraceae bacterium]
MNTQAIEVAGSAGAAETAGADVTVVRAKGWNGWIGAVILAVAHVAVALVSLSDQSPTFDEPFHLFSGYALLTQGNTRLMPENGWLPQVVCALPLLAMPVRLPPADHPTWQNSDMVVLTYGFLYVMGNPLRAMVFAGQCAAGVFAAAAILIVDGISRRIWGPTGGILSAAVAAASPTMLAHAGRMTSDMAIAAFLMPAVWLLWRAIRQPSPGRIAVSILAITAALLSKMSGLVILPLALILAFIFVLMPRPWTWRCGAKQWIVRGLVSRIGHMLVLTLIHVVLVIVLLHIILALHPVEPAVLAHAQHNESWDKLVNATSLSGRTLTWVRDHHLVPHDYLYGIAKILFYSARRSAFFLGQWSLHGWTWFYPYAFLAKTGIGELIMLLTACVCAVTAMTRMLRQGSRAWMTRADELLPLLVMFVLYGLLAIRSNLNIGHRYILPMYPVMFVLIGGLTAMTGRWRRPVRAIAAGGLLVLVVESIAIWPHDLAFFNQLVGGPRRGYRQLVDSSLDWGQDLPALVKWIERHRVDPVIGPNPNVFLAYFGTGDPKAYGYMGYQFDSYPYLLPDRLPDPLQPGIYCISATMLQSVYLGRASGEWTSKHEQSYQRLLEEVKRYQGASSLEPTRSRISGDGTQPRWVDVCRLFNDFRLARLNAMLRQREPDDRVGYSILIYRLSRDDVIRAQFGPVPIAP